MVKRSVLVNISLRNEDKLKMSMVIKSNGRKKGNMSNF